MNKITRIENLYEIDRLSRKDFNNELSMFDEQELKERKKLEKKYQEELKNA